MKWGFITAGLVSILVGGCYTGEEEATPPLPSQDTSPPVADQVAIGALVYDNWLSPLNGVGGEGLTSLSTFEQYPDYVRCVSCHGWDRLGQYGGITRKPRTLEQPNSGFGVDADIDTISRRIYGSSYTNSQITHNAITGRTWAEGSAVYNDADGPATGNQHPNYTQPLGLDSQQLDNLRAFLNDTSKGWDSVFSAINRATDPVSYTLISRSTDKTAADLGASFYSVNCASCHGQVTVGSQLPSLLEQDGGHSEFMFRSLWGSAIHNNKTNASMGSPRPTDVANLMAHINRFVRGDRNIGVGIWNTYGCGALTCHGQSYPTPPVDRLFSGVMYLYKHVKRDAFPAPRLLSEQEVANLRAYIGTL